MDKIEAILNVNIVIAKGHQLSSIFAIRQEVYCSIGKLEASRVQDSFDERATQFLGGIGQNWVASARMVTDHSDFEMEKYFDLSHLRSRGKCAEINRFAILPDYRGKAIAYAMFRGFYRYAMAQNIRYFCIVSVPGKNSEMYKQLGFSKLADTVMYEELKQPHDAYVLDLEAALDQWQVTRPRILEYFLKPIDGIG